jgi:hypothetical protein
MWNHAPGSRHSDAQAINPPPNAQYLQGTARFGASSTIAAPAAVKKIPVAPCRIDPAMKIPASAAKINTPCASADRNGG